MKRTLIVTVSLIALLATAAIAQEHRMRTAGPAFEGPGMAMHDGRIVEFLQLTADQKVQWDALHSDLAASVQPLIAQTAAGHEKLHALLEAATPDPTAIGNQLLAIHGTEKQVQAAHNATAQKVEAILTADQKTRFEAWKATRPEGHVEMMKMAAPCSSAK